MFWEIASTITQFLSGVAIIVITIYFNSSIKKVEKSRREEEERNGKHERNQIRLLYIKELATYIKEVKSTQEKIRVDFINANRGSGPKSLISFINLFDDIKQNHENLNDEKIIELVKQSKMEEATEEEYNNFDENKKSFNNLQDKIYNDFLIDLEMQTLIEPESFYRSLQRVKDLTTQNRKFTGMYEEEFAKLYICSMSLEKELLNLQSGIKSKIENNLESAGNKK